ncbi:MAG: hypothetical protein H0T13_06975 [Actinobacteria bacterium]|nr:hypothetical protein [Actinomycetota bacterium]
MLKTLIGKSRLLGTLVVAGAMATGAYAFTATNTVPTSSAGSGSGTISGYTVSAIAYQLNATTPTDVDSVTFTLSANATVAKAKIVAGSSTYTACSIAGGVNVTCNFSPDIAITTADSLSVIATS